MLLTAIGELFTASRTTNVPSVVSNAMSFDASILSVAGWDAGQPFAFDDALGVVSGEHALNVSVATSASATAVARTELRMGSTGSSHDGDGHGRHQQHLADDDLDSRNLRKQHRRKNRCRWWHGECAE